MRLFQFLATSCLLVLPLQAQAPFLAKPFLQVGAAPKADRLDLAWLASDRDAKWGVELQIQANGPWKSLGNPTFKLVALAEVPRHRVYTATLPGLKPGAVFHYRVSLDGKTVFQSEARGPKTSSQPQRLVLYGDGASGSEYQRAIAFQMARQKPDAVFVLGDLVYARGRASEYLDHYFSIYNADAADLLKGAPLLRSVPTIGVLGNHDVALLNARGDRPSDGLAYYLYWNLPLNGPDLRAAGPNTPMIQPMFWSQFLAGAGQRFPKMGSYSLDLGNAHWTVLDSNPYVDWADPALKAWLEADLRRAAGATWRFVAFHHPGFNSSTAHFEDQWMRLLSPVFEKYKVQMVFSGHVHAYQRSLPLSFKPEAGAATRLAQDRQSAVNGTFSLDKAFDGLRITKAKGIIYIISGAGGASLYNTHQDDKPETWQPFTKVMVSDRYSFTVLDLNGKRLEMRQIADDGKEIDHFVLTQ
ncbi:MAG: metallophosphoesterase [Acidobacteriota bacterium]|nr:metallophosphoesterase [Acidobacteriota bacterium]